MKCKDPYKDDLTNAWFYDLAMRDKLAKRYKLRVVGFVKDVSKR